MRRVFVLGAVGLAFWAPNARAVDWSVTGDMSESVELSDNRQLLPHPLGASYNSYTGLNLDALALTPTSRFEMIGSLKYRAYGGPGEANQMNSFDKGIFARYEKQEKSTTYNVFGSYSEVPTSTLQLIETGFATVSGSTISQTVGGGLRHEFSPIDSGELNTTYYSSEFPGSGLTPFTSWTTNLDWRHRASNVIDFIPNLQVKRLAYQDPAGTQLLLAVGTFGTELQISPRASFSAAAGPLWAQASNNGSSPLTFPANPVAASATAAAPASGLDWIGNAQFVYRWTPSLTGLLSVAKITGPTSLGNFQSAEVVSGSLAYAINTSSSISLTQSFSHVDGSSGLNQIAGTSAAAGHDSISTVLAYGKQLAREWNFEASYQYIRRISKDSASSNTVVLTIRKNFTVLP